jgi:hypothetical protein
MSPLWLHGSFFCFCFFIAKPKRRSAAAVQKIDLPCPLLIVPSERAPGAPTDNHKPTIQGSKNSLRKLVIVLRERMFSAGEGETCFTVDFAGRFCVEPLAGIDAGKF